MKRHKISWFISATIKFSHIIISNKCLKWKQRNFRWTCVMRSWTFCSVTYTKSIIENIYIRIALIAAVWICHKFAGKQVQPNNCGQITSHCKFMDKPCNQKSSFEFELVLFGFLWKHKKYSTTQMYRYTCEHTTHISKCYYMHV